MLMCLFYSGVTAIQEPAASQLKSANGL